MPAKVPMSAAAGIAALGGLRSAGGITPASLAKLVADIGILEKVTSEQVDELIKALLEVTAQILIDLTPSDTGNMMNNWFFTQRSKSPEYKDGVQNSSREAATNRLVTQVNSLYKDRVLSHFTNNSPYCLEVEFGGYPIRPDLVFPKRTAAIKAKQREREKRGTSGQTHIGGFTQRAPQGIVRVAARELEAKFVRKMRILINN